jgi:hypothetical protein
MAGRASDHERLIDGIGRAFVGALELRTTLHESHGSRCRIRHGNCLSLTLVVTLLGASAAGCKDEWATDVAQARLAQTIQVPGNPLEAFDVSWVDSASRRYYLADRANAGVEVIDASRGQYLRRFGAFRATPT